MVSTKRIKNNNSQQQGKFTVKLIAFTLNRKAQRLNIKQFIAGMWIHWCCTRQCDSFPFGTNSFVRIVVLKAFCSIIHFRNLIFFSSSNILNTVKIVAYHFFLLLPLNFFFLQIKQEKFHFICYGVFSFGGWKKKQWTRAEKMNAEAFLLTKESFMWWHFSNNAVVNCISCRWSIELGPKNGLSIEQKHLLWFIFADSSHSSTSGFTSNFEKFLMLKQQQ